MNSMEVCSKVYELRDKYNNMSRMVIKRKKVIQDFIVKKRNPLYEDDVRIYADSEKLHIGKKVIKMCDMERVYIMDDATKNFYGREITLWIVGRNLRSTATIPIKYMIEEDLNKIEEFLKLFIFSDEIDERLESDEYEFLINRDLNLYKFKLSTYDLLPKTREDIIINDKEYTLMYIFPKRLRRRYLIRKKYLVLETRYQNPNYMDILVEKYNYDTVKSKPSIQKRVATIVWVVVALGILINMINALVDFLRNR